MEEFFLKLSVMLVPFLLAVTCHEVSHGFVADRLGDNTARSMGRLTLNPIKHLDILGTIMLFYVGIGWAKPVPVNFNRLRRPRRDMILVAVAGPITNFALAIISAIALRILMLWNPDPATAPQVAALAEPISLNLAFSVYLNLLLGLFNLIPVPPLDGGRVAVGMLPFRLSSALARVEPVGMIIIVVLVFFTSMFDRIILPALAFAMHLLVGSQGHLDPSFLFMR